MCLNVLEKFKQIKFKTHVQLYCDKKNLTIFKRIMRKFLEGGGSSRRSLEGHAGCGCERVRLSVKKQREGARPA